MINNQYAVLNLLLNHAEKKPKLVILELASIDIMDSPKYNTEKLSALHPYYSLDDSLKAVVKLQGNSTYRTLDFLKLYSFNSSIHLFIKHILGDKGYNDENKGFVPMYAKWGKDIQYEPVNTTSSSEIDSVKIRYLRRFVDRCNEESIKVILMNSPNYIRLGGIPQWKILLAEFASNNCLKFVDYEQEESYLINPNLFNEPYHLNIEGATKYTKEIIPHIRMQIKQ